MKELQNIKLISEKSGIIRIILNDPKTYNSLSFKTINNLIFVFNKLEKDSKCKVIIIEGAGKGFCAGHNLKEIQDLNKKTSYKKLFDMCSQLMIKISYLNKPVIAKVHGAAFAAGCQLVATCDLAYSSNKATFSTPGINIGLFCSTPMVALSRKVNRKKSMQMLLIGESVKAKDAKAIGLINDYFPALKLEKEVMQIAKSISSKSNLVLKIGKKAFYKQIEMPLEKAYKYTSKVMTENMMKQDASEGIKAFIEKRSPIWKNK